MEIEDLLNDGSPIGAGKVPDSHGDTANMSIDLAGRPMESGSWLLLL